MAGYFVMIWMYLRHKMYIMCRIIPLLRAFCLFFFFLFPFSFCFFICFPRLGTFVWAQYAFRYDTSSCRAGLTDSFPPWHGDHRATQEQNNYTSLAASLDPVS